MSEFKIEKGIPAPVGRASRTPMPFAELEIGDSFVVPDEKMRYVSVAARASDESRKHAPKRFIARQTDDKKGTRVWRIADVVASPSEPSPTQ